MNMIRFNIHNSREGILTVNKTHLTCISDQVISNGDVLLHPQYTRISGDGVSTFVVDEIDEERPSRGDWEKPPPSTFRRIKFKKEIIPSKVMKEAGYLHTETVMEKGKTIEKIFLKL